MASLRFVVDVDDVIALHSFFLSRSKRYKRTKLVLRIILVACGVALFAIAMTPPIVNDPVFSTLLWIVGSFAVLFGLFFYDRYYDYRIRRVAKKYLLEQGDVGGVGEHKLWVDEEGLEDVSPSGRGVVPWDRVSEIATSGQTSYVFFAANSAVTINRRHVLEGDVDTFLEAVRQHMNPPGLNVSRP